LQRILAECESAKQNAASASTSLRPQISSRLSDAPVETNVSNPLIEDQAWFVPHTTPDVPVYIGESSSTAFATSLRQVLDHSCTRGVHVPRTHYVPDTSLVLRPMSSTSWPSEARARLLVKVALAYVGRTHHIILASATFDRLHQIYQDLSCITDVDVGKFFGLFALGEAYSITSKPADGHEVRGLAYFITASKIAQNVPERATLACIENLMLLVRQHHKTTTVFLTNIAGILLSHSKQTPLGLPLRRLSSSTQHDNRVTPRPSAVFHYEPSPSSTSDPNLVDHL